MSIPFWGILLVLVFSVASMAYVFAYRGRTRFASLTEYMKKGWPIFAPFNCLLYLFTPRILGKPIIDSTALPDLSALKENWQTIREEVVELHKKGYFEQISDPTKNSFYDIGFRTFYKYGWSKFYLTWYGYTHSSALKLCPKTVAILKTVPSVNGAMFSLLPPGSQLTRHLDPVACSLRYHLGLMTPNSESCYINVDGNLYHWRDGEDLLFDETYLHFAKNETDQLRLILMCDVERRMPVVGRVINLFYKSLMRMTVVPNMTGDKRGLVNLIFSSLSPLLKRSKNLKQTNRGLYLLLKYSVNITLLVLVTAGLYGAIRLVQHIAALAAQ